MEIGIDCRNEKGCPSADESSLLKAYGEYRKEMDRLEIVLSKHLPCWNIEIREHRKGSFELLLVPPLSKGGNEMVFYLNAEQAQSILAPCFHCSARNFFGFDLINPKDFKA